MTKCKEEYNEKKNNGEAGEMKKWYSSLWTEQCTKHERDTFFDEL